VDGQLSRLLLDGQLRSGQEVTVDVHDGLLAFTVGDTRMEAAGAQKP